MGWRVQKLLTIPPRGPKYGPSHCLERMQCIGEHLLIILILRWEVAQQD